MVPAFINPMTMTGAGTFNSEGLRGTKLSWLDFAVGCGVCVFFRNLVESFVSEVDVDGLVREEMLQ